MNKEEKIKIVDNLKHSLTENKNIYFTEVFGLDAQQTSQLRRMCFEKGVHLSVVKNTLLRKAMDACDKDFSKFNEIKSTTNIKNLNPISSNNVKFSSTRNTIEEIREKVSIEFKKYNIVIPSGIEMEISHHLFQYLMVMKS